MYTPQPVVRGPKPALAGRVPPRIARRLSVWRVTGWLPVRRATACGRTPGSGWLGIEVARGGGRDFFRRVRRPAASLVGLPPRNDTPPLGAAVPRFVLLWGSKPCVRGRLGWVCAGCRGGRVRMGRGWECCVRCGGSVTRSPIGSRYDPRICTTSLLVSVLALPPPLRLQRPRSSTQRLRMPHPRMCV
mgnify:CR=1 FL=1